LNWTIASRKSKIENHMSRIRLLPEILASQGAAGAYDGSPCWQRWRQ